MSRVSVGRQLARTALQRSLQPPTVQRCAAHFGRPFSSTSAQQAEEVGRGRNILKNLSRSRPPPGAVPGTAPRGAPTAAAGPGVNALDDLAANVKLTARTLGRARHERPVSTRMLTRGGEGADELADLAPKKNDDSVEPYHFHIFSHKHNTHVTVTKPNREVIISISCGNLGFRKSGRKHFDSAYQVGAYVLNKLHQNNLHNEIDRMEVILRGFGAGREAVTKVLLSPEGRLIRDKIVRVTDSTRLKFGGTRSQKPRRV